MKKKITVIIAVLVAALVLAIASCGRMSDKVVDEATDYLVKKYGDIGFEVSSYTQNKTTNGRYVVNVHCNETDTDFTMFMYSLRKTDGYSVTYANNVIQQKIMAGPLEPFSEYVSSVQWKNEFEDGLEDFTYRTMEIRDYTIEDDVDSLYLVQLDDCPYISNAAGLIYDVILSFEPMGVTLKEVSFVFEIGSYSYTVKADYGSATDLKRSEFVECIYNLDANAKSEEVVPNVISIDMTRPAVTELRNGK